MEITKVAILDIHEIFRKGIIESLNKKNNLSFIFESTNSNQLFEQLKIQTPEILITDIELANESGIDICKKVKALYSNIKVIALSSIEDKIYIESMFDAGANAYLFKHVSIDELKTAVNDVVKTGYYLNRIVPEKAISTIYSRLKMALNFGEIEVLKLISLGLTTAEIAEELNLSPKTVENYRNNMLNKTGSRNVAGLITFAIKGGYVKL